MFTTMVEDKSFNSANPIITIAFGAFSTLLSKATHTVVHTHILTPMMESTMQGDSQLVGEQLGLCVLLRDTATRLEEGFKQAHKSQVNHIDYVSSFDVAFYSASESQYIISNKSIIYIYSIYCIYYYIMCSSSLLGGNKV